MDVILDTFSAKDKIQSCINKFGNMPEHNLHHYFYNETSSTRNAFFYFGGGKSILATLSRANVWSMVCDGVLCSEDEKADLLLEFCSYCLNEKKGKKVVLEISDDVYYQLKGRVAGRNFKFRIGKITYPSYWPVIKLQFWDETLNGSEFYELRKIKNYFDRKNGISIMDSKQLEKRLLKDMVYEWKGKRRGKDRAFYRHYIKLIDNGFNGTDYSMSVCIEGKPSSILCGWRVPNSNCFHLAVALHNYAANGLGEYMYLQCLNELKKKSYEEVNLGGSWDNLLLFKEKFKPHYMYRTFKFSVIKSLD